MNEKQSDPKATKAPPGQTEPALRDIEQKFQGLLNVLPMGVAVSTPGAKGVVTEVNAELVKIFEYDSKEEFLKVPAADHYVDLQGRARFLKLVEQGAVRNFEARFKRKDDTGVITLPLFPSPDRIAFWNFILFFSAISMATSGLIFLTDTVTPLKPSSS